MDGREMGPFELAHASEHRDANRPMAAYGLRGIIGTAGEGEEGEPWMRWVGCAGGKSRKRACLPYLANKLQTKEVNNATAALSLSPSHHYHHDTRTAACRT